jgi:hypothetical protein
MIMLIVMPNASILSAAFGVQQQALSGMMNFII